MAGSRVICVVVAALIISGTVGWHAEHQATAAPAVIADFEGIIEFLRTDGEWAVWTYQSEGKWLIAASRVDGTSASSTIVRSSSSWANAADVDHGVVVWHEVGPDDPDNFDIYGADLTTGTVFPIATSKVAEVSPSISGNWVVWSDYDPDTGRGRIMARNIVTMDAPIVIATSDNSYRWFAAPQIDGSRVVWLAVQHSQPGGGDHFDLMYGDLNGMPPVVIDEVWATDQMGVPFAIHGEWLAYGGNPASGSDRVLTMRNLATGEGRQLERFAGAQVSQMAVDDRYVYWFDNGLWAFDLSTTSYYQIEPWSIYLQPMGVAAAAGKVVEFWLDCPNGGNGQCTSQIRAAQQNDYLPTRPQHDSGQDSDGIYFSETGHSLTGRFESYWAENGGLPVFGYPLTDQIGEYTSDTGMAYTVQYTERQRFELHTENAGTPYDVLLGRLGAEALSIQGRRWQDFETSDPSTPHFFDTTGHAIVEQFWPYWSQHGLEFGDTGVSFRESLALFGYPLSELMLDMNVDGDTVLTQYFERAVFEWHPDNPEPYRVLLRRVGVEVLNARGW